jgi:hypothetical protein
MPSARPTSRKATAERYADDNAGECGPITAVLSVDVLHDLLAPLVLEVDVDVGRLVAFDTHEAFEQHSFERVHFGDAQAVADGGVRGAATALGTGCFSTGPKRMMSATVRK